MTTYVDVSEINRRIPAVVAFGRRTLLEQSVTSAYWICHNAQQLTPAVAINRIDSELSQVVQTTNRFPKFNEHGDLRVGALEWTKGMMIAVMRTDPQSPYSVSTGNRWPLAKPGFKRGDYRNWEYFRAAAERMQLARHSSTHFLQHGWAGAIQFLFNHPDMVKIGARGAAREQAQINPANTLDHTKLGWATVSAAGDTVAVTAANAVGDGGNAVLDAKHRQAMIDYGTPPLQAALDFESEQVAAKTQQYLDRGLRRLFDLSPL